jgi:hypothetical protein
MAHNSLVSIVVGKLIIDLLAAKIGIGLKKRPGCSGRIADFRPGQIGKILLIKNDLCLHCHHLLATQII